MNQYELLNKARASLYKDASNVCFNLDGEGGLIDLTLDVAGITMVDTNITDDDIERLKKAKFVVQDNPASPIHYWNVYKLKKHSIQYGDFKLPKKAHKTSDDMVYGVLSLGDYKYNTKWAERYLNGLDANIIELVEDKEVDKNVITDAITEDDLEVFLDIVDVLIIPAPNGTILPTSLILAFIGHGIPVISNYSTSLQRIYTSALTTIQGNPTKKKLYEAMALYGSKEKLNAASGRGKLYVKQLNDEAISKAEMLTASLS